MKDLKAGLEGRETYIVKFEHLASEIGSGSLEVLSTPSLVSFVENLSYKLIEEYLSEGYTSVGYEVYIRHLAPVPKGEYVEVYVKVSSVEDRRIRLDFKVYWRNILIADGHHIRYVVNIERFMKKINDMS